nr:MAG TPA: hypothetical protein [Caudoviricetes sp.]
MKKTHFYHRLLTLVLYLLNHHFPQGYRLSIYLETVYRSCIYFSLFSMRNQ